MARVRKGPVGPSRPLSSKARAARPATPPLHLSAQDERVGQAMKRCWRLYRSGDEHGRSAALRAMRELLPALTPDVEQNTREQLADALDVYELVRSVLQHLRPSDELSLDRAVQLLVGEDRDIRSSHAERAAGRTLH